MRRWLLKRLLKTDYDRAAVIFIESTTLDATGHIALEGFGTGMIRPGEYLLTPIGRTTA